MNAVKHFLYEGFLLRALDCSVVLLHWTATAVSRANAISERKIINLLPKIATSDDVHLRMKHISLKHL